jgi:hypothetical protein
MKGAFVFLAPEANNEQCWVKTPHVHLLAVAVPNYDEAVKTAKQLVESGIQMIELCGGFGNKGLAMIADAVEGKASVGAVRFDCHPGLEGKSGDNLFK